MPTAFFPNAAFGWCYVGVLVGALGYASYTDWRWLRIPNLLAVTLAAVGLGMQATRGAWLGEAGWLFGSHGGFVGALDAILFGLVGFIVGFVLLFLLWILGGCGGGDVKLFAAVSIWTGAWLALWIFVVSALGLALIGLVGLMARLSTKRMAGIAGGLEAQPNAVPGQKPVRGSRWLTYSFPLLVAVAVVLCWTLRRELLLVD
jgi:prepilin peptidase CpaA